MHQGFSAAHLLGTSLNVLAGAGLVDEHTGALNHLQAATSRHMVLVVKAAARGHAATRMLWQHSTAGRTGQPAAAQAAMLKQQSRRTTRPNSRVQFVLKGRN